MTSAVVATLALGSEPFQVVAGGTACVHPDPPTAYFTACISPAGLPVTTPGGRSDRTSRVTAHRGSEQPSWWIHPAAGQGPWPPQDRRSPGGAPPRGRLEHRSARRGA